MEEKIIKILKSIHSVKILKGPIRKTSPDLPSEHARSTGGGNDHFECVLLVSGKLMPVTFYGHEDIRKKFDDTCRKWKIPDKF